jgi:hypothetical protein
VDSYSQFTLKKKRQHETTLHGLILYHTRNHVAAKNELPLDGRKK